MDTSTAVRGDSPSPLALSVLDQNPVFFASSPRDALGECVRLAQHVEELGYLRFWVAEHHGEQSSACASPLTLCGVLAARTRRLRVGAGGVALPHHNPLAVAEAFRLLDALFPGRIDLGIGRGPGASDAAARALAADPAGAGSHERRLVDLLGYLDPGSGGPLVVPDGGAPVAPWVLGSSLRGAVVAGRLGLPFSMAQFAHPAMRPDLLDVYRSEFRPSAVLAHPRASVAVRVACAETPTAAELIARCVWMVAGDGTPWWDRPVYPDRAAASRYPHGRRAAAAAGGCPWLLVTGDAAEVAGRIREMADGYRVDEVVITTICPDFASRARTFDLLAEQLRPTG